MSMGISGYFLRIGNIVLYRQMGAIIHDRAEPGLHRLHAAGEAGSMIEVKRDRHGNPQFFLHRLNHGRDGGESAEILDQSIGGRQYDRRLGFLRRLQNGLNPQQTVNIELPYSIVFLPSALQHLCH